MPLTKLQFRPGVNRETTSYTNEGGWFDSNNVRFRFGLPEKIGGWVKAASASFLGVCRALHTWVTLEGTPFTGVGTTVKYYIKEGDAYYDITPLRSTTAAGDVTFAAVNTESTLTVTDAAHGAVVDDFVTFAGATTLGGVITAGVLNQEYQIVTVTSANVYTIEAKDTDGDTVTANSSDSGNGGSSVVGTYQINVGLDVFVEGSGWGAGLWGASTWGSVSALSDTNQLRLWSHDNFGEDLVMNVRGGGIYYWDESSGVTARAVAFSDLSNANLAPTKAVQILVSDVDRHIICFGADPLNTGGTARTGAIDPMFIAWSDQENATQWEPLPDNTAGSFRLSAGSSIIGALRARQETLVWTDTSLYSMSFIGQPFTFGVNLVNEGIGLIGPNAAVNSPAGVFWMDKTGFYTYNGQIRELPCSVQNYVLSDINIGQAFQTFATLNKEFDEVGWFYCSSSSTTIDKYVTYNYTENVWSIGQLNRTAWLDEGYLYNHETGNDADGSPMDNVYIESSDFDLGEGTFYQMIRRIIPDIKFTGNGGNGQIINFVVKTRNYPAESLTTSATNTCTNSTSKIDVRVRARQAALRIESDDDNNESARLGVGFRVGATRMDLQPSGRR